MKRYFCYIIWLLLVMLLCGCASSAMPEVNGQLQEHGKRVKQYAYSDYSDNFFVLYEDGTVGIGYEYDVDNDVDSSEYLDYARPALEWKNVEKLWCFMGTPIALHTDGTVSCTGDTYSTDHLVDVVDICIMEPVGFFFLLADGSVECGTDPIYFGSTQYQEWSNVRKLVSYYYCDMFAVFEDGTVKDLYNEIPQDQLSSWTDIVDVYCCEGRWYGIKEDGSIVIHNNFEDIPNEEASLAGAQSLYPMDFELAYGLTEEGELLVSGGKSWFSDTYIKDFAATCVDFSEFKDITQLEVPRGDGKLMLAVRKDGSVVALKKEINEYVSQWTDIKKVILFHEMSPDNTITVMICGLQYDGNVVALEYHPDGDCRIHDNYLDGNIQDIYLSPLDRVIGIRLDGSVVGHLNSHILYEH